MSSPPASQRDSSGQYYAAAWGSPYATPSPKRTRKHARRSESSVGSLQDFDYGGDWSSPEFDRKSRNTKTSVTENRSSAQYDLSALQPESSVLGDWAPLEDQDPSLLQILSTSRSERPNWLSDDDSAASELGSLRRRRKGSEGSISQDWLGFDEYEVIEDLARTPTLKSFVERKEKSRKTSLANSFAEHRSQASTETLKQSDIWTSSPAGNLTEHAIMEMEPVAPISQSTAMEPSFDKPLPTPPVERRFSATIPPSPEVQQAPALPLRPNMPAAQSFQRPKRKVAWRNKACVIALPLDDSRGSDARPLLTPQDVDKRMKQWENEGFDLDSGVQTGDGLRFQSRPLFPTAEDIRLERSNNRIHVKIPNKAEWDAYVKFLAEEKLRALGVTFGEEEPPTSARPTPGPAGMSRASSQISSLANETPLPTSSVASNPALHGSQAFSPTGFASTNGSSQMGPFGSPASPFGNMPANIHRARQSIAFDPRIGSPFGITQLQPTPSGGNVRGPSPQHYFAARGGNISPAVMNGMPNLADVLSPVSPQQPEPAPAPQTGGMLEQMRPQQQDLQAQLLQQQHQQLNFGQPAPMTPLFGQRGNTPEMMHPTPQGHHRNVSEALEREVDSAGDRLENSIRKQLERDADKTQEKTPLIDEESHDYDRKEADIIKGLDLDQTDEETNPSFRASPNLPNGPTLFGSSGSRGIDKPTRATFGAGHRSKPSLSGLNVQAKPFDPQGAFASSNFSFGSTNFSPSGNYPPDSVFGGSGPSQNNGLSGSLISVNAPSFVPTNEKRVPSSEFKFSSSSFNVEAPAFNPGSLDTQSRNIAKPKESPTANTIFGDFNIDIAKPARRSKAVPIVRPDTRKSTPESDEKHIVNFEGRAEQLTTKRMRRGRDDGDSDAQITPSSPHLTEIGQKPSPAQQHTPKPSVAPVEKENVLPQSSVASPVSDLPTTYDAHDAETSPLSPQKDRWQPFEFKTKTDVENFAAAEPTAYQIASSVKDSKIVKDGERLLHEEEISDASEAPAPRPSPPPRRPSSHKHSKSSLSATAPPFVPVVVASPLVSPPISATGSKAAPKPAGTTGESRASPKEVELSDAVQSSRSTKPSGLQASRWAATEPLESSPTLPVTPSSTEHDAILSDNEDIIGATPEDQNIGKTPREGTESVSEADNPIKPNDDHSTAKDLLPRVDGVISPSFEDIDAVMRAMDEDPDLGVERLETPYHTKEIGFPEVTTVHELNAPAHVRSDAPSPSPKRVASYQALPQVEDSNEEPDGPVGLGITAPINKLNREDEDAEPSDWNDVLSAGDEDKFTSRTGFFDGHVNDLVGSILDDRLGPVERSLEVIQKSLTLLATKPAATTLERTVSNESDADDEDDDEVGGLRPASSSYRSRSPMNRLKPDRRLEQIKAIVREALAAYQPPQPIANVDLSRVHEVLAEMKLLAEPEALQGRAAEIRRVFEDVISTHPRLSRSSSRANLGAADVEKLRLQVDGLETMLRVSNERADEEYKMRRQAEADLAKAEAAVDSAEAEAARQREAAEEAERSLREMFEERKVPSVQNEMDDLQHTVDALSLKNQALESTLEEYRIAHDQWKQDIQEERDKTRALRLTLQSLKKQIDESSETRQALRHRFERLQDDMIIASENLARDQLSWKRKEEEYISKNENMLSVLEHESQTREKLEVAYQELKQEHAKTLTFQPLYEQSQKEVERLNEMIQSLREENKSQQDTLSGLELELIATKENHRIDTEVTRKDLEADIVRLRKQLADAQDDAVVTTAKHQAAIQELHDSKVAALQEAARSREAALEEQHRSHERALNDLRERHGRALHNSSEDKQRIESHLQDKIALSNDKVSHLENKVSHLEERLEVAKEAARAAAEAASISSATGQKSVEVSAETSRHRTQPSVSTIASMPFAPGTSVPEKISPQALRESIIVLQDQLQNREATIESLTSELAAVDKTLPDRLKERDIEVNWLRELLSVRLDDLQDIINTLTKGDAFNTDAARDAAIRLKASLQMEQQLKERHASGVPGQFPSLSSLSSQIAAASASPRATAQALPMAAAAAWGNWRKARDFSASLSDLASSVTATPSKSSTSLPSSAGLLSGLMTPPATSASQRMSSTPTPSTAPPTTLSIPGRRISSDARPLRSLASSQPRKLSSRSDTGSRPLRKVTPTTMDSIDGPKTPTHAGSSTGDLLRGTSYDEDASETRTLMGVFGDEETASSIASSSAEKPGRGLRDDMAGLESSRS